MSITGTILLVVFVYFFPQHTHKPGIKGVQVYLWNRAEENILFGYLSVIETTGIVPEMSLPAKPMTKAGNWTSGFCEVLFSNSLYVHFLSWLKQKALMMIKLSVITGKNWRVLCGRKRFLAILPYWHWPTWFLGITRSGRLYLDLLASSHPLRIKE